MCGTKTALLPQVRPDWEDTDAGPFPERRRSGGYVDLAAQVQFRDPPATEKILRTLVVYLGLAISLPAG